MINQHTLGSITVKYLLSAIIFVGIGYGQAGNQDLTTELMRDMQKAIMDSVSMPMDSLSFQFAVGSEEAKYLNTCISKTMNSSDQKTHRVDIQLIEMKMSIDQDKKSLRNTRYLRQLEVSVFFAYAEKKYNWRGRISDSMTKPQLKKLLGEAYPVAIGGDYVASQPPLILIMLSTMGVFSLGAALFFIRT